MTRATAMARPRAAGIAASAALIASLRWPRGRRSYAERSFRGLVGGVRPPGRAGDDRGGVHADGVARHRQLEAVQAGRGRAQLVLAGLVVLRAVARAFERLAGLGA